MFPPGRLIFQVFGKISQYSVVPQYPLIVVHHSMVGILEKYQFGILAQQLHGRLKFNDLYRGHNDILGSVN